MIVNGKKVVQQKEISIQGLLEQAGYDPMKVAVEKNGAIISKKYFASEMLSNSDRIEIVCFVGGG